MYSAGMGIALISSQPQWGGGEQWLWSLGQGLRQQGARVHWIVPESSPMALRLERDTFPWLPVHGRGRSWQDIKSIRYFLRRSDINVVHFNDSHAVIGTSLALLDCRNVARVATKHTIFPLRSRQKYEWMIDRMICVSKAAQRACLECGMREEKTAGIYGAVDIPKVSDSARDELLAELGLDGETQIIVHVGNLLSCKGQRYIVEAMPQILKAKPKAKLLIAGEGRERGELEATIARLGLENSVRLLGFRNDATQLLAAADVVVQPSLAEALSLVAIESQLLLRPLVATAVGGLAEVVGAEMESPLAEIVTPESAIDIATAVERILESGAEVKWRCQRAAISARQRFSMERMVSEIQAVYSVLIRARRGSRWAI